MLDPVLSPLKPLDAKRLAAVICEEGTVHVSSHAVEEMANDHLETTDCLNLIRAGVFQAAEFINNEWRYRVESARVCVVITFLSREELVFVTAWRKKT